MFVLCVGDNYKRDIDKWGPVATWEPWDLDIFNVSCWDNGVGGFGGPHPHTSAAPHVMVPRG